MAPSLTMPLVIRGWRMMFTRASSTTSWSIAPSIRTESWTSGSISGRWRWEASLVDSVALMAADDDVKTWNYRRVREERHVTAMDAATSVTASVSSSSPRSQPIVICIIAHTPELDEP